VGSGFFSVWTHCVDSLCGLTMWTHCVDSLCGHTVWTHCVDLLCGLTMWTHCVDSLCGLTVWTHCMDSPVIVTEMDFLEKFLFKTKVVLHCIYGSITMYTNFFYKNVLYKKVRLRSDQN